MEIINCEQNSPEWLRARAGIPTASMFATVLAKGEGKTRRTYMMKLAGEIITGDPMDSFSNEHTERGHEQEPDARDLYAFQTGATLDRVGFIKDGRKGCSPDSLIGEDGGAEIKTRLAHLQAELLCKGEVPTTHKAQIQGTLWISRRKWWDFVSYCPKMPLFVSRVERDDPYIQKLATEVDAFNRELDAVVAQIRDRGEAVAA
jgi:hypothetical protein